LQEQQVEDEEDIYLVEKILAERKRPGKGIEYHVKWKGYDASGNTWEPACNLREGAAGALTEFKKRNEKSKKGKKSKKKKREEDCD
jgi:hypothetical protein